MPPGRSRIPRLADHQINQLMADYDASRNDLICPKCSIVGRLIRQGSDKADPPMPAFRCNNCSKYLNHVQLRQAITQATTLTQATDTNRAAHPSQPDTTAAPTPGSTTAPALVFEHHEALPEFMQTIMTELTAQRQRLDEHSRLYEKLAQLTAALDTAHNRIVELEATNARLLEQIRTNQPLSTQPSSTLDFPELNGTQASRHAPPPNIWSDAVRLERIRLPPPKMNPQRQQQRQTSAARMFTPLSETHGFRYIYFPSRARIPTGQVRKNLRHLDIPNSRILDIHYPERQVMALLVHNDYAEELQRILTKVGVAPIPEFDPLDPAHLQDPKYATLSEDERAQKAREHHNYRIRKAVETIRFPVKYSVAKSFAAAGWLSPTDMKELFPTNREHAADMFTRSASNLSMSFDGDAHSIHTASAQDHDFDESQ